MHSRFFLSGFINNLLSADLSSLTSNTVTDPLELTKEFDLIRNKGFSFDNEGNNLGICAFAVPVFDKEGIPVASILVAGTSNQVTVDGRKCFIEGLQAAAGKICQQLSGEK